MADEPETGSSGRIIGQRLISLEVRSRRFGFAVFQGEQLIDYGSCGYPAGKQAAPTAVRRMASLLDLHAPATVIARQTRRVRDCWSRQAANVLRTVRAELQRRGTPLGIVARREIISCFAKAGISKKHNIARAVAGRFPELQWRVPSNRKPWDRESDVMVIFDAAATFVTWSGGLTPMDGVMER